MVGLSISPGEYYGLTLELNGVGGTILMVGLPAFAGQSYALASGLYSIEGTLSDDKVISIYWRVLYFNIRWC